MIKINLIPPEALEKEKKKKFIILGILGGSVFVALAIIFLLLRLAALRIVTARQIYLEAESKRYQVIVDEVNRLKSFSATLESKKNIIESLMKGRLLYPRFMEFFMTLLPPEIWITNMDTTSNSGGLNLTISCISYSNFAIADFVASLEASKRFTSIELGAISTAETGDKGIETYTFQLTCGYRAS
jgi:Tfp pilus assembly protein PilN